MPWITLPKALDHVGGDKDRLQAALAAGDTNSRMRSEDGTVQSLSPKKWRRGAEVDWEGSRLAVTKREYVTSWDNDPPRFVSVEVDLCTLLESFPADHSFITLGETLELFAFGGPAPTDADAHALAAWDATEEKLKDLAASGKLPGIGLKNGRGEFQKIPDGFWLASTLDPTSDRAWLTKPGYNNDAQWTSIKFKRRDVLRLCRNPLWPGAIRRNKGGRPAKPYKKDAIERAVGLLDYEGELSQSKIIAAMSDYISRVDDKGGPSEATLKCWAGEAKAEHQRRRSQIPDKPADRRSKT